jgi:hypothetical protein
VPDPRISPKVIFRGPIAHDPADQAGREAARGWARDSGELQRVAGLPNPKPGVTCAVLKRSKARRAGARSDAKAC